MRSQSKGYGSEILKIIKEIYKDKTMVFDAESIFGETFETATNKEQRLRRAKFYEKNGFTNCKISISYCGQTYDMYANSNDKKI